MTTRNVTISEALAAVKSIPGRVKKKSASIQPYVARQKAVSDPLEAEGGSRAFVKKQRQSISDLLEDMVRLRVTVLAKSLETKLTIEGKERTIQEWIIWRREVEPVLRGSLEDLNRAAANVGAEARKHNIQVRESEGEAARDDFVLSFDQKPVHTELERLHLILSQLDGALSRINATTEITVPDGPFTLNE